MEKTAIKENGCRNEMGFDDRRIKEMGMKKIISTYLIFAFMLMTFSGCDRIKQMITPASQQFEENSNNNAPKKEEEPQKAGEEVPATPEVVATTSWWRTGLKVGAYTVVVAMLAAAAFFGKKYYDYHNMNLLNPMDKNRRRRGFLNWLDGHFEFTSERDLKKSIPRKTTMNVAIEHGNEVISYGREYSDTEYEDAVENGEGVDCDFWNNKQKKKGAKGDYKSKQ